MKKLPLLAGIFILLLCSCEKNSSSDIVQPVVFEYEYINYAWGYRHLGWMIDEGGRIKGFNLPQNWNDTDKDMIISKEDLRENLNQADTLFGYADNSEMLKHYNNRFDFLKGDLDTSGIFMADAGIGALYAYIWSDDHAGYRKVLLAQKGDISVTNTSSQAKSAVKWLRETGEGTGRFYWFDQ
jgi:hypothetical protein